MTVCAVVDDRTVEIGLKKVYAPFISNTPLILVLNEKLIRENSKEEWRTGYLADHSAGAGPYMLSSWQRRRWSSIATGAVTAAGARVSRSTRFFRHHP
ncbi:hypothetical protein [Ensifer canadensis]|jgi:ABC-type transport system substrate-binding protein|uniref:hypothetical protein n=1 Tax=Ensifer canadensis TaxID=555315 RepID=UPI001CEC822C|nr:hypothetical protein [Ensifer canadensis]